MGITIKLQKAANMARAAFEERKDVSISIEWGAVRIATEDATLITMSVIKKAIGIADALDMLMYVSTTGTEQPVIFIHEP